MGSDDQCGRPGRVRCSRLHRNDHTLCLVSPNGAPSLHSTRTEGAGAVSRWEPALPPYWQQLLCWLRPPRHLPRRQPHLKKHQLAAQRYVSSPAHPATAAIRKGGCILSPTSPRGRPSIAKCRSPIPPHRPLTSRSIPPPPSWREVRSKVLWATLRTPS